MDLPVNLRATAERWLRPNTLLFLAISLAYFWPGIRDQYLLTRPWVASDLRIIPGPVGTGPLVEDRTTASSPVSGERRVWVEDSRGLRLCDGERNDGWEGATDRLWTFPAFTEGCNPPDVPFRVCTSFVVQTLRGARGGFGPFCTGVTAPPLP